jgi:hypothetical protein
MRLTRAVTHMRLCDANHGHHSALGEATPGVARPTTVGRSPTARPVVPSTGVGQRVTYLMIFRSTMLCTMLARG